MPMYAYKGIGPSGKLPSMDDPELSNISFDELADIFREQARGLIEGGADLLLVPAAFTHITGLAHWEVLLRARAIENLAYVIAPAQGGKHANGRSTHGHSMIIDPWGVILAERDTGEGVVVAEVDREHTAKLRGQLPALEHRRVR